MKKLLALTAVVAMFVSAAGCSADMDNNPTDTVDSTNYKVGVGSYTTTEESHSASGEDNGKGAVSTTYATVVFDENDIIKKVYIDEVETKIYFDAQGNLDENRNSSTVRSKRELGDSYGMKAASGIGKEWYEQVNTLEDYLVGKSIRDISDYVNNNHYGMENGVADESIGDNAAGNALNDAVDGAKNIADGIMNGARNILGRNSSSDTNGTDTAEGVTNDTGSSVADGTNDYNNNGANSATNDKNYISNSGANSGENADNTGNTNNNNTNANGINWEEDLKSGVTIDVTYIQRALQKAYENAR